MGILDSIRVHTYTQYLHICVVLHTVHVCVATVAS